MAGAQTPDRAALRGFYDDLLAAYGPQHWWPLSDPDNTDPENARFEILVGAVLTQHTAWTHVETALGRLRAAGPLTAQTLLAHADLPGLIRAAGPHRVKAQRLRALCTWFIDAGGFAAIEALDTASLCARLRAIRGIGPETADVIALYAFDRPRFIADAYAFRVFERYGWWSAARRYEDLRRAVEAAAPDAAAAFYAELHALIVAHAKARCHKRTPECGACVLASGCALGAMRLKQADGFQQPGGRFDH